MTPRERTNAAVRSQSVDRVPKEMASRRPSPPSYTSGTVSATGYPAAASFEKLRCPTLIRNRTFLFPMPGMPSRSPIQMK